jgi:SAM-dependent methyltransferase
LSITQYGLSRSEVRYWNGAHSRFREPPRCDGWLQEHLDLLRSSAQTPILDLGCGKGRDCQFLVAQGLPVIACDFSPVALCAVRHRFPAVQTVELDLRHPLPFAQDAARVIVSDLTLHYFSWATTVQIVAELSRVLQPGGTLLCRVNSTHEVNYAGQGIEVEPHYYDIDGHFKRFFSVDELRDLFCTWEVRKLDTYLLFDGRKHVIEIVCAPTGGIDARHPSTSAPDPPTGFREA